MQLNEGESDLMTSWDEVQVLLPEIEPITDNDGQVIIEPEARAKESFETH